MIPSDLSFGYLSAELKSPVKIPILGLDTFVIGRAPGVVIRDYEAGETLVVAKRNRSRRSMRQSKRYTDELSVKVVQNVHGPVTHVRIGAKRVARLDGEWTLSQLEDAIEFK